MWKSTAYNWRLYDVINGLYTVQYISDLLDFMEQQVYVMYIKTCFHILCVSIVYLN